VGKANRTKKPVDSQSYKGYEIVLPSFDWDALYEVYKDGKIVHRCQDRQDAKDWVDQQPK
jgi:hypothetical protein